MSVTISKSFTAAGNGDVILVKKGDSVTYDLSGTFVATLKLEYSDSGGLGWVQELSTTSTTSGTFRNKGNADVILRWRCSARSSGTAVTSLVSVSNVESTLGGEAITVNEESVAIDRAVTIAGTLAPTGAITSNGVAVPTISSTSTLTNKTLTAPAISAPVLSGTATGTYTLGGTPTLAAPTLTGTATFSDLTGSGLALTKAGFAGSVALTIGEGSSNGLQFKQIDELVDLTALGGLSKALTTPIPAGSVIISAQATVDELVVAGGTTVKVALGLAAGDVDKYGKTANLTLNQKIDTLADWAVLASQEDIAVCGVVTDGTTLGDTNITAGKVQVRIVYLQLASMANAA